jgi:tetratricopeptide (TPR) repeat protein
VTDPAFRTRLLLGALLAVAALYLPFLGVPWEYDDKVEIVQNRILRHPGSLGEMIAYNPFRVLLLYTFSWDLWAWGIDHPGGFRLGNILIHGVNVALVLSLLDRLGNRHGQRDATGHKLFVAAGTLLFAVHPLAIESVTYVSGRSSSLATAFVLGSFRAYIGYLETVATGDLKAWETSLWQRWNLGVGVTIGAGLAVGVPAAVLASWGKLEPERAAMVGAAGAGVLVVLAMAVLAGRWRELKAAGAQADRAVVLRAGRLYTAAWALFVLGCLTKEIAATLPGILFLAEGTMWQRSWKGAFATLRGRLFPFFAIPAFLIALRTAAYGYIASPEFIRPWEVNLLTQIEVVGHYLRLWAVPYPQSIYHELPVVPMPGTPVIWLLAAAFGAALVAAARQQVRAPTLAFGVLCLFATLAPTSSVFALKETMVEHRTYLPSVGYAFAVAWAFGTLLPRLASPRASAVVLAILVGGYSVLHVSYDLLWRSEEVLWTQAVRANPQASDAWRNLGDLLRSQRRLTDAESAYRQALLARDSNVEARSSLGLTLGLAGRWREAEQILEEGIDRTTCYTPAINNLAMIKRKLEDLGGAVDLYDQSLRCNPDNPMAHLGLGHLYYGPLRNRSKAAEHYSSFLDLTDPHAADVPRIKQRVLELTW